MLKRTFFILLAGAFLSADANDLNPFFTKADAFLKKYVDNGLVNYSRIKGNFQKIEYLYKQIGAADLSQADDATKKAFYVNAYNLVVIYWVTKHYPLKSPMDASGFFDKVKHRVAGEDLTLNALEIKKLLQAFNDARFHFVLACAAKSCPPLANYAFMPDKLEQQLTDRTAQSINDNAWLKVDKGRKKVEISKIFEWYKNDFTRNGQSLLNWINQYRREKIPAGYSIVNYEYNWELNETVR